MLVLCRCVDCDSAYVVCFPITGCQMCFLNVKMRFFYRYNLLRISCISTRLNVIDIGSFNMTLFVFYTYILYIRDIYIYFDTSYVIERLDPCATLAEQLAGVVQSQMGSRRLLDITILYVPTIRKSKRTRYVTLQRGV